MGGICFSHLPTHPTSSAVTPLQQRTNKIIEETLKNDQKKENGVMKVLLLGAGECGKSTILKQMKILHLDGFKSPEEKNAYKALIWKNTMESLQALCHACNSLGIPIQPKNEPLAAELTALNPNASPLPHLNTLHALWSDPGIQKAYSRSNEFHLLDSAAYFLNALDRTIDAKYEPTEQDILRSRVATTGIIETDFKIKQAVFKMYDVGGQRGERKKWIHCFDNVTAIMFIASLSEYDQVLAEDRTKNRLDESLNLFEGIINLPWFKDAPIILFLNKNDIFSEKISKIDIGIYHPEYVGGLDYDAGLQYIQDKYFERNPNPEKKVYCHVTDATNTENVAFVWKATQQIIMEMALKKHFGAGSP